MVEKIFQKEIKNYKKLDGCNGKQGLGIFLKSIYEFTNVAK